MFFGDSLQFSKAWFKRQADVSIVRWLSDKLAALLRTLGLLPKAKHWQENE